MLEYVFQDAVQGELESDLQRHVDQVVELLVKSHHTLEATQLLCLDSLSSNSDLFATLVEFTPRWMESLQNVSSSSWSSDPAPVPYPVWNSGSCLGAACSSTSGAASCAW